MQIYMVGVEHDRATIEERERFSFTQSAAVAAMARVAAEPSVVGCVLLATCNRTELWLHGDADPYAWLCALCGADPARHRGLCTLRAGEEAVNHLLETACGMRSRLFGEDQIVTQVGQALALARSCGAADGVLERLFRTAVTAAKAVKSQVRLSGRDSSAATRAVTLLREQLGRLVGLRCLVIGNGEMGRLAAEALVRAGCHVTMTLRQYRQGEIRVPAGCETVAYSQRMERLAGCQAVVSATASPHYTIQYEAYRQLPPARRVLIDLAVPRDIDPAIGQAEGAALFDIDQLSGQADQRQAQAAEKAREILRAYRQEFADWYAFRGLVPVVQEIGRRTAEDVQARLEKPLRRLALPSEQREALEQSAEQAAGKAVARLLYGLREQLPREQWQECLSALERSARQGEDGAK